MMVDKTLHYYLVMNYCLVFIFFSALINVEYAAKIGIFTTPLSNSQMIFNIRLADTLLDAGHEVVLIRPTFNPKATLTSKHPKYREIRLDPVDNPEYFRNFTEVEHRTIFGDRTINIFLEIIDSYTKLASAACEGSLNNDGYLNQLKAERFDLAFHGHFDYCHLGIFRALGIPKWIFTVSGPPSRQYFSYARVPSMPSVFPGSLTEFSSEMNYWERFQNFFLDILILHILPRNMQNPQTELLRKKFGDNLPHLQELIHTPDLVFINGYSIVEYQIPRTDKIQYIGGLGTGQKKPLVEPFVSFVKRAKKLVVVSFGSVAISSEMPASWKNAFLDLFRANPDISFVWKFEDDVYVPDNVLRSHWIPQNDLLAQEKTVAAILHGGYNSLGEIVATGKPCVFVPLFADQTRNAKLAEFRKIGVIAKKTEITGKALDEKLHEILDNPEYSAAAAELHREIKAKPTTAEQDLVYWTEFVIRNKNIHMDVPQLGVLQYYSIDVIALPILTLLLLYFIFKKVIWWYYWSCFEMSYKEKEKIN